MPNRLAQETSPYLLQHKDNPVDWYPWGEEALKRARDEDKPILLSVGYSACHWCHVMAHECFENGTIAAQMNAGFINIKVDREERPDLDQIYQNVAQALTRSGGWPLTVFLTPDLRPFFGGTYFPPEDRYGRPGFPRVLDALSDAYKNERESVAENAAKLTDFISSLESVKPEAGQQPTLGSLRSVAERLISQVDWEDGGFGSAPKFPNTMGFSFLWRIAPGVSQARDAALLSLTKMAQGGIYDQLGGGFHRYSVDATWSVPHFEKMLYDNALLLKQYSEVLLADGEIQAEQKDLFTDVLVDTVAYLEREMLTDDGLFYAAQDADSEGEEGKYFVWDPAELQRDLTADEAKVFALRFGVSEGGNFEHGKTVLYLAQSIGTVAGQVGCSEEQAAAWIASAKKKLLAIRRKRIAPGTDTKVLTSWNALMISGLAWTARALAKVGKNAEAEKTSKFATRAFSALRVKVGRAGDRLWSTYQAGTPKQNGYLDDYAFLAAAAIDLSSSASTARECREYLHLARAWIGTITKHFSDSSGSGYFFTSDDHEKLIQRPKTIFDQAIPSGTAVALRCMIALSETLGPDPAFETELTAQLAGLYPSVEKNPYGCAELLCTALLRCVGAITVSGKGAGICCTHPHVFRKPVEEALLLCHQGTCSLPLKDHESVCLEISRILGMGIASA